MHPQDECILDGPAVIPPGQVGRENNATHCYQGCVNVPEGGAFQATHKGLVRGQSVKFCDLKARAELNGNYGRLVRYDMSAGRWHVRMMQETIKVRPANLRAEEAPQERNSHRNDLDWDGSGDTPSLDDILLDVYDDAWMR